MNNRMQVKGLFSNLNIYQAAYVGAYLLVLSLIATLLTAPLVFSFITTALVCSMIQPFRNTVIGKISIIRYQVELLYIFVFSLSVFCLLLLFRARGEVNFLMQIEWAKILCLTLVVHLLRNAIWLGIGKYDQPRSYILSTSIVSGLVLCLFFQADFDRFYIAGRNFEDLADLIFILFEVGLVWSFLSYRGWNESRLIKFLQSKPLLAYVSGLVIFALFDISLAALQLGLIYDLSIYQDYWTSELALKASIFLLVFHLYFSKMEPTESVRPENQIKVSKGRVFTHLPIEKIDYSVVVHGVTHVVSEGQRYTYHASLEKLEQELDESFFRANRQLILSRHVPFQYESSTDRKIKVVINPNTAQAVEHFISRLKAPAFRVWVSSKTQGI